MLRAGFSRRCLAALAIVALIGLGTIGIHHLYTDAMSGDEAAHDCLTCRVIGSSVALVAAAVAGVVACRMSVPVSFGSSGVEHAGFTVRLGSRAPPVVREPSFLTL